MRKVNFQLGMEELMEGCWKNTNYYRANIFRCNPSWFMIQGSKVHGLCSLLMVLKLKFKNLQEN